MRNETRTYRYLKQLFPKSEIIRQYRIKEKIYLDGKLIRSYVKPDFYLIIDDVKWIVEYNGKQHYELTGKTGRKFGGKKGLAERQARDEWLRQYCKKKNIRLLEIDGRKYVKEKIKAEIEDKMIKQS